MTKLERKIFRAAFFAFALTGAGATVATVLLPGDAYAKSAKAKARGHSKAATSHRSNSERPNAASHTGKVGGDLAAIVPGARSSDLGALNAAHANAMAFEHASPNSRVGKIAAYRDAVEAMALTETELAEAQAVLDGMDAPARPSDEIYADYLAALDAGDPAEDLWNEYEAALAYEQAASEVDGLSNDLDGQDAVADELLADAANKPVTDDVEAALRQLLGLE